MVSSMLEQVCRILGTAGQPGCPIRPTDLYNEGWMLRLLLDSMAKRQATSHPFRFATNASWFSEALLYSEFLARSRPDELAEGWTNADGVIGHFLDPSQTPNRELRLAKDPRQFVVIEAKMFSGLSSGITRSAVYDQAARSVACMAAMLKRANVAPQVMKRLAFYVVAPQTQIRAGKFRSLVTKPSIAKAVEARVASYGGARDEWLRNWIRPTLELAEVELVAWETVLSDASAEMKAFYANCLRYERGAAQN